MLADSFLFFATMLVLLPAIGFFLTLAFFPKKSDLSKMERIVFSAILGLVLPALLLLAENQVFGVPINFVSSVSTIIALLAVSLVVFYLRKK